jgi:hypothetical protein
MPDDETPPKEAPRDAQSEKSSDDASRDEVEGGRTDLSESWGQKGMTVMPVQPPPNADIDEPGGLPAADTGDSPTDQGPAPDPGGDSSPR